MSPKQPRLDRTQTITVTATQDEWEALFSLCAEGSQSLGNKRVNARTMILMALRVIERAQRGEAFELRQMEKRKNVAQQSYH